MRNYCPTRSDNFQKMVKFVKNLGKVQQQQQQQQQLINFQDRGASKPARGQKTRENVVVLDLLAVDNFDFMRKIAKNNFGEKLVKMLGVCQN